MDYKHMAVNHANNFKESRAGIENITFSLYIYLHILSFKVVLH